MNVARSVAEVLSRHTMLTLECVDPDVPERLRAAAPDGGRCGPLSFREMRGAAWPSSVLTAPITERFVNAIKS